MHSLFKWTLLVSAVTVIQSQSQPIDLANNYDNLFPYRIEACALTDSYNVPYKPRFDWGHVVVYLSGVCRDTQSDFPKIKSCDLGAPGEGVTISVNSRSKNVNWLAIPGKSLSFYGSDGSLSPLNASNQAVNQAAIDRLKNHLKSLAVYKGIDIYPEDGDNENLAAKEEVLAEASVTMEAGITFARNLNCVKLPVAKSQVAETVTYLNSLNDKYFKNKNFRWNPLFNNCAHLVHNVLAQINVWGEKNVDTPLVSAIRNAAVPANEPLDLLHIAYQSDLNDPLAIYNNSQFKKSLLEKNWLPIRHGVIAQQVNMTTGANDLFSSKKIAFHTFQLPDSKVNYSQYSRQVASDTNYTDLTSNLKFFRKKYQTAIAAKQPLDAYLAQLAPDQARDFAYFYHRYYSYLSSQLDDVNQTLKNYEN